MSFKFSHRSIDNLKGVHPDLVAVVWRALELTSVDFVVIDGLRSEAEHKANVAAGRSWTKRSRHQDGKAIDFAAFVEGKITWDAVYYGPIVDAFKEASDELGIPIICGADWKITPDLGHIELDRRAYP